jgi:tetratricopeptide (TPR) repeat protein
VFYLKLKIRIFYFKTFLQTIETNFYKFLNNLIIYKMITKIKALFVTVMIAAGVQAVAQVPNPTKQAMAYLDYEQYNKAKAILEGQASATPSAENQFALGYYYLKTNQMDLAKAAYAKGLTLDPKNQLNNIGMALLEFSNKKYSAGKALIEAALLATKSKNADVLYRAAEAYTLYEHTNDPAEALRLIELLGGEKIKKEAPEYQIVKGDAYMLKNDGGPAVSAYERALALDAKSAKALTKIGVVFKRGKNYKRAGEDFRAAILADSNYAPLYREFGELYLLGRQYKNSAYNYDKYLAKSEPTCENKLRYVKLAFLAKNYEGAKRVQKEVEDCINNNTAMKNDLDIPRMKGYINFEEGKHSEAVNYLTELLKKLPADKVLPSDISIIGRSHQKLNNDSLALYYLNQVAPTDTIDNFNINLHDILYKQKKYPEAAKATLKSMAWKNDRKEKPFSGDYFTLAKDYYFGIAAEKDTLKKVALAQKVDSTLVKLAELKSDFVPTNLWRARANLVIDVDKTKGLAVPFYEKYIPLADKEKNKNELIEAYKYLAFHHIFYSPIKDKVKGDEYINQVLLLDPENAQVKKYKESSSAPAVVPATIPATKPGAAAPKAASPAPAVKATVKPKGK